MYALLATATPPSSGELNDIYLVSAILLAVVLIAGALFGLYRYFKAVGVREAKIDELLENVPTPAEREKQVLREEKLDRVIIDVLGDGQTKSLRTELFEINRKLSPNGLDSQAVGDIVKRTELQVAEVRKVGEDTRKALNEHVGEERANRDSIWRAVHSLQQSAHTHEENK